MGPFVSEAWQEDTHEDPKVNGIEMVNPFFSFFSFFSSSSSSSSSFFSVQSVTMSKIRDLKNNSRLEGVPDYYLR